jgi:hypothetical protein
LGIIIAGTLTIIGVISRGEATLAVGRILLVLMLAAMAVCILRQPVLAGLTTLASFLKAVFLWLVVTVLVMALVMLGVGYLLSRCKARLSGNHDHDGGESLK